MDGGVHFRLELTDDGAGVVCTMPIARVRALLEKYPNAYDRLFCSEELAYCRRQRRFPWQHYAVRLAAKLGYRALIQRVSFNKIEIIRSEVGSPSLQVQDSSAPDQKVWLSLSHEGDVAVAFLFRSNPNVDRI